MQDRRFFKMCGFILACWIVTTPSFAENSDIPGWSVTVSSNGLRIYRNPANDIGVIEQSIDDNSKGPIADLIAQAGAGVPACGVFSPAVERRDMGRGITGGAIMQADGHDGAATCMILAGRFNGNVIMLVAMGKRPDRTEMMRAVDTLMAKRAHVTFTPPTMQTPSPLARKPVLMAKPAATAPFWAKVQTVTFTMWSDMQFHPTILFKDGMSFDVGDDTLSTFDFAASRRADADSWGRWRQVGAHYFFTDSKGNQSDHIMGAGGIFQVFPAVSGLTTLSARYKSVSGSIAGDMAMLSTRAIRFAPGGRFTQDNSFTATGASVGGGSARQFNGRYAITGHSIVLTFDDGRRLEKFFGFGSTGSPARASRDMIFIGHESFVSDD